MGETSEKLFREACQLIPGGVNSPVRSWRAVGSGPVFIQRGRGAEVVDADGRSYVDCVGSWGPLILGHAHPRVVTAVAERMQAGASFGAPTAIEVELARLVIDAVPSVQQARLVSSGTEATMTALRIARAATQRDVIVKFAGCYHGHSDSLLVRAGSGALTLGVPDSPGVPAALAELTVVLEFNDVTALHELFVRRGHEVAAVILEPVAGNMGVVPPAEGFLAALREETSRAGAVLIFDEVMTGFRIAWGGAQERYGVEADLTCLGKVIGGGMPLAAVGGQHGLMAQLAPIGPVYQAGTLSGNPVSVAAGLATLQVLREHPAPFERLEQLGARIEAGLIDGLVAAGVKGCVNRVGSMLTLFIGTEAASGLRTASQADTDAFARFFHGMMAEGVYLPPSQFEAWFLSLAHTDADIDRVVRAARRVLATL